MTFTDLPIPTEIITSTLWAYGDGTASTTSTLTHTHLYTVPGVYTVTLTVSGLGGNDTQTRTGYITVTWSIISRVITYTHDLNPSPQHQCLSHVSRLKPHREVGNN